MKYRIEKIPGVYAYRLLKHNNPIGIIKDQETALAINQQETACTCFYILCCSELKPKKLKIWNGI